MKQRFLKGQNGPQELTFSSHMDGTGDFACDFKKKILLESPASLGLTFVLYCFD